MHHFRAKNPADIIVFLIKPTQQIVLEQANHHVVLGKGSDYYSVIQVKHIISLAAAINYSLSEC